VAIAEIERLTFDHTSYIASNATRRLRELHEEKPERVKRDYRKEKHGEMLAYYRYVPSPYENFYARQALPQPPVGDHNEHQHT
jgi:hypothetical protein